MTVGRFFIWLIWLLGVAGIVAGIVFLMTRPAEAHEWFPDSCCHGRDCRPVGPGEVKVTPAGFFVVPTAETILFGDERIREGNPTIELYRCTLNQNLDGRTMCIFPPMPGG